MRSVRLALLTLVSFVSPAVADDTTAKQTDLQKCKRCRIASIAGHGSVRAVSFRPHRSYFHAPSICKPRSVLA